MRAVVRWATVATAISAALLRAQGSPTLDAVAAAMGGRDRLLAVRSLAYEGTGSMFNLGQNLTPDAELPRFEVTAYRRVVDLSNRRMMTDLTREPRFVTGNAAPQRQRFGVDGEVAYNLAPDGAVARANQQAAIERAAEQTVSPLGFVQAAYAAGATVSDDAPGGTGRWVRLSLGPLRVAMLVDQATMLPLRVQRLVDQPMLGDVVMEWEYSDWRDVNGLRLPTRVVQKIDNRFVLSDLRFSSVAIDSDIGDLAAPAEAIGQPAPTAPPVSVTVEDVAPGVWLLGGQTHHSVAIETARSIVLVEAPQHDARTLAVIEKARTLRPEKPVDLVINTHHHFDHAGGIRAAISQGLTILTHQGNRDFYERTVFPRRHSIAPDALTLRPMPLRIMTVADKYVRRDSVRTIEIYRIDGSQHAGSMVMVYLPSDRLLIEADLYSPPAATATTVGPFPFAGNLLENIQRRGLEVERIVPIHGRVVPFSELQGAATRAP